MASPPSLFLTLYRGVTRSLALVAPLWLAWRAWAGKEEWSRHRERYGADTGTRPNGHVIWCHAASVGEALTLLPLLTTLLADKTQPRHAVVTTGTVTSAALMAERLPLGAVHRYIPLDHQPWIARFIGHWRPDVVLWTESELWPNALAEIAARQIPAALINARLSDRAFAGWLRRPAFARNVLSAFQLVLAQSAEDGRRFTELGAAEVHITGNLKLAADPLPVDAAALSAFADMVGDRPRWLAASVHPGEDDAAAQVHRILKPNHPNLLTVLVPRHPTRADDMVATMTTAGLNTACRSRGEAVTPATDIYIADTMGELGLFYRACGLVFMGKSLAVGGGQNPAEAALMGRAVMFGPDMSNFRDMTKGLLTADAAVQVASTAELATTLDQLLRDPTTRQRLGDHAHAFMTVQGNALAETLNAIAPLLGRLYHSAPEIL